MPPTLIQETGAIVANANTFVLVDDVTAYVDQRVDATADWYETADDDQVRCIVLAWDYLRNESRYLYRGERISVDQMGPWPRNEASEYRGPPIANNVIPWRMKHAQCDLAMRLAIALAVANAPESLPTALQPDLAHGGRVESERVDVIARTFFKDASPETVLQTVHGLLAPILREIITDIEPFIATPHENPAFRPGEFSYPSGGIGGFVSPGRDGGDAGFLP